MKSYELVIIGGGAAGLFAALSASVYTSSIAVIDKNAELGRKIGATGNGKCNFTNSKQDISCYRSDSPDTAWEILKRFDYCDTVQRFYGLGILSRERNGYYYPVTEQASTVKNILSLAVAEIAKTYLNTEVTDIEKNAEGFKLTLKIASTVDEHNCGKSSEKDKKAKKKNPQEIVITEISIFAKKVIFAAGGAASPVFGTDGGALRLVRKLGIEAFPMRPALVALNSDHRNLSVIAGVRLQAKINLINENENRIASKHSEAGEIIFSKTGISGIPVMSLSRFLKDSSGKGYPHSYLEADLLPDISKADLLDFMKKQIITNSSKTIEQALCGIVNNKLLYFLMLEACMDPLCESGRIKTSSLEKLAEKIKNLKINITGDNGFENAQTTAGGVPLTKIDPESLESLKVPGIYFAGEILDVDGTCGGYNLQWAWTTGAIAGACAGGGHFDKDKFLKTEYR